MKLSSPLRKQMWSGEAIHAWLASFEEWQSLAGRLVHLLNGPELERMRRFKSLELAERYAAGRGLLRELLGGYLEVPADRVEIETNKYGKPEISSCHAKSIFFNLAHTDEFVLYGFSSSNRLGVDIENILPGPILPNEIRRVLSKNEIEAWEKLPESEQGASFFQTWVRKEAVLKALGVGLAIEPATFSVGFAPHIPPLRIGTDLLRVCDLTVKGPTRVAIALVGGEISEVSCYLAAGSSYSLTST